MSEEKKDVPLVPREVIKAVETAAISRHISGSIRSEADFFAGAMAAFIAIYGDKPGVIPIGWVMQIMSGRGVVEDLLEEAKAAEKEAGSQVDGKEDKE